MKVFRESEKMELDIPPNFMIHKPYLWLSKCTNRGDFPRLNIATNENVQIDLSSLQGTLASTWQTQWKDAVRLESFEWELKILKEKVEELKKIRAVIVTIDTMAPEPFDIIKPFHAIIEPYEDEYLASFPDANLSALGDTWNEAIWNLKDIIAATYEMLSDLHEDKIGAGLMRQFKVLKVFISKKSQCQSSQKSSLK